MCAYTHALLSDYFKILILESKQTVTMTEVCSICLTAIDGEEMARMPGCEHAFHRACLLNSIQYDARCAICRQVGTNVVNRNEEASDYSLHGSINAWIEENERYDAKKRHLLRRRRDIAEMQRAAKRCTTERERVKKDLETHLRQKWSQVWTRDVFTLHLRKEMQKARRRELRRFQILSNVLELELGPMPYDIGV